MTTIRPLTDFDPGPNSQRRWNAAFEAAMDEHGTSPFVLYIDQKYALTEKVAFSRPMNIQGLYGVGSLEWTVSGNAGIVVPPVATQSHMSGVNLIGPNAFYVGNDDALLINAPRCVFSDIGIGSWGGTGLRVEGDVSAGTNANENRFTRLRFGLCGFSLSTQTEKSGAVYIVGGDSNGNSFMQCDATDCRRGFWDESFLGNTFVGCTAEACNDRFVTTTKVVGYGYGCHNPNARSTFIGCYCELDSESDISGSAIIIGGFFGPNRGKATALGVGGANPHFSVTSPSGQVMLGSGKAGMPADNMIALAATGAPNAWYLLYGRTKGWWSMKYANLQLGDAFRFGQTDFWVPHDLQRGNYLGLHGFREVYATSLASAVTSDGGAWQPGDRVIIAQPVAGTPSRYCCTAVVAGVPTWKVEATLES